MFYRCRWLFCIALILTLLPIVAALLWALIPLIFGFPIVLAFGPITPSDARFDCLQFAQVLSVRNRGLFAAPMRDWWIRDGYGAYQFPDRWIAPGEEIRIWSGTGSDDAANLYAGRRSPVWETTGFTYRLTYFEHSQELFTWSHCHPW
jgi:hypothetical protein